MNPVPVVPPALAASISDKLAQLAARPPLPETVAGAALQASLDYVWACSAFCADACLRDAGLLDWLATDGRLLDDCDREAYAQAVEVATAPGARDDAVFMADLRRFRRRQLVRIAWRDLAGFAPIDTVLHELSWLADACIDAACRHATTMLGKRHGLPHDAQGRELSLLVLGMGKLGGGELNFSSDIDLVFAFPAHGETTGPRPLEHEEFFTRTAKRVAQLLGTPTDDGFVYRVDLRLRPFGDSGPVAVSFDAVEDYLQQHGRDWERYAYVKARPVFGAETFDELHRDVLRPFVYRRYLDFGVFESLRGMKELIAREVERRELRQNVKLGPGGIREIEFIVQAFQLLRGGSNPRLQTRSLLEALPRLAGHKLLPAEAVEELLASYRFLRRVENRLQEWNDEQTHDLPEDAQARERLALAMGLADWTTLAQQLETHRARVSTHFRRAVFAPGQAHGADAASLALENVLAPELDDARRRELVAGLGVSVEVEPILQQLQQLRDSSYYRRLDETGRRRLHVLLPWLLRAVVRLPQPDVALSRVLNVLERIGGRTVYLALLHENPIARERLLELCAHSKFLADQIAAFPLLLDELLDARLFESVPTRAEFAAELRLRMAGAGAEDPEQQVELLRQFQRAAMFRIAVPDLTGRLPLMKVSDRLTDLAELIVQEALDLAWQQITARHGVPLCGATADELVPAGVVVVAYGKFGGIELGYGSDLDLVFLHDSHGEVQHTAGPQVVDNGVFFLRLVQRLVHLLTVHSSAGRLYEVDTRLRPSGKGGLLVQSIEGFAEYQRTEAWTWEHQALLRSRAVAGTAPLRARYEALRVELLRSAVRRGSLREDVRSMRERMRAELARTPAGEFDLKQDAGGITDIEFLAQYWALLWAERYAELVTYSDNIRQLESLASICLVPQSTVDLLTGAYRTYRQRLHHLSLEGERSVAPAAEFETTRETVTRVWRDTMLDTPDERP
ncbi:MAG TPA: bifunctional [glutamate--ammonia ligase]-adenylyl-L-tyrosine phosphorylase/[glutamate--ammonia-ligase] adenylyltransferase [Steroidobacteraceae bacterium]|nr:bifunctional [glutamate--ammonia ligase]-adenylyl-L-tyrosine phosphorylase/[glutamate--ammonia-ligase] adenylyltransferase [Steroidobacteraceae bacterium]